VTRFKGNKKSTFLLSNLFPKSSRVLDI